MANILLLEPDKPMGGAYRDALEYSGHSVELCHDAQSAVIAADSSLPDAIVTEIQIAAHNGVEFLYELRSYAEWQKIPIIVVSSIPALGEEVLTALWQDIRISAYHYKPLARLHDIIQSLENVLAPVE